MSLISEAGSYRGVVLEHTASITKESGLPRMEIKLRALEFYDDDEKIWLPCEGDNDRITAFLTLFNKHKEPIFHARDVMRVFEWDGKSLITLNNLDLEGAEVQFEVAENVYNEKTSMKVQNIRGYNDEPGNSLKKLDDAELSQLNAEFSAALKKLGGAPKVASAKAKAPAVPAKATTKKATKKAAPKPPAAPTAKAVEKLTDASPELPVEEAVEEFQKAPPKPPKAAPKPATAVVDDATTYEGSWGICCAQKAEGVTDDALAQAFTRAMYNIAPNQSEDEIVAEDWQKITDTVTAETGTFAK